MMGLGNPYKALDGSLEGSLSLRIRLAAAYVWIRFAREHIKDMLLRSGKRWLWIKLCTRHGLGM